MKVPCSVLAIVVVITACDVSDPPPAELVGCIEAYSDVAALATAQLANHPQGDAALLVRVDGQSVCRLSFGSITPTTQVHTVSAAKWLTAATVLAVVDAGSLALDTKTSQHFPDAPSTTANITVSQLLSHTSGLLWFSRCMGRPDRTLQECAEEILDSDLHFDPGTGFFYAGTPFTVAGAMAERAMSASWADLFRSKIAEPLGMTSTSYGAHANPALGEGDVVSTLDDYGRFAQMLLDQGLFQGRRVLSENAIEQMRRNWTVGVPVVNSPRDNVPYGLGAWLDEVNADGNGVVVSSPGSAGFIPIVDYTRRTVILFVAEDERIWPAATAIIAGVRAAVDRER